jgi:hypothetical protein
MTIGSSCAFCGRSGVKMSREHVFPQWLSRAGSYAGNYTMQRGEKTISTPLIEVITKRVCEDCNTGWLSRIETGAKAVLEPLLDATTNTIAEIDRWIIARWFTKTILTAQLALVSRSSSGIIGDRNYHDFYEKPQPFNNSVILISGYHGPIPPIGYEMIELTGSEGRGFRVFFHFHRLVLTAFAAEPNERITVAWPHNFHTACHLMWPSQRGFLGLDDPTLPRSWPPPYLLDQAAIELFLRTMRKTPEQP